MKKRLFGLGVALVAILSLAAIPVFATTFSTSDHATVAEDATVDGSYFGAGDTVRIQGTVNGDVFCAGNSVEITGTIRGDVLCAGQTITVNGAVEGDVRVAGQTVTIGGTVDGSVTAAGMTVTTKESAIIKRDVTVTGQSLVLDGTFGRDLVVGGQDVQLGASVARDARISGQRLTVSNTTVISRNLDYTTPNEQEFTNDQVLGEVTHTVPETYAPQRTNALVASATMVAFIVLASILYPVLAPRVAMMAVRFGRKDMLFVVLLGIASLVGLPILAALVMVTVVGIPLGIVLLLIWGILLITSIAQAAVWIGNLLLGKTYDNVLVQTLGGAAVIGILFAIPFVNLLAGLVVTVVGAGLSGYFIVHSVIGKPHYTYTSLDTKKKA